MATGNSGGHDYLFVDKNGRDFGKCICKMCKKVLKDPHITGCCGQHYCESCLENWFSTKHGKESCPHCRAEGKKFQHFLDKSLKPEIDSLRIYCTNKKEGCRWAGELGSLKDHLESANGCDYVEVECTKKCGTVVKRKVLSNHLRNDCHFRRYQCKYCGYQDTYQTITGIGLAVGSKKHHYDRCPEFPLECINDCGRRNIKRRDMIHHLNNDCPEEVAECPYECEKKGPLSLKRKELSNHVNFECHLRPFKCVHCELEGTHQFITTEHYSECQEFPLSCPNSCRRLSKIKRKDMQEHREHCPKEPVQCPFEEVGCKPEGLSVQDELKRHMSANQQDHLLLVLNAYKEMKKENQEMKKELKEIRLEHQWK